MNELDLDKKNNKITHPEISQKFKSIGFENLTEIQKQAIPKILEEKNCLIIAPMFISEKKHIDEIVDKLRTGITNYSKNKKN